MPMQLSIVTPERTLLEREDAEFALMPGAMGDLGVMPGHASLLSTLNVGEVMLRFGGDASKPMRVAVAGGFVHIMPEKVAIVSPVAELADEIDVTRAEAARTRAEERLKAKAEEIDVSRAEAALARALNRLAVAHGGSGGPGS